MERLTISNAQKVIVELQEEISRSTDSRYAHRLRAVLLVAQGMSCSEVAQLLDNGTRTIQLWVHRFENEGLSGLQNKPRPGRPPRLTEEQLSEISCTSLCSCRIRVEWACMGWKNSISIYPPQVWCPLRCTPVPTIVKTIRIQRLKPAC